MGRDKEYPLSIAEEDNLQELLMCVNKFRNIYDKPLIVSSGYRPGPYNKKAGGAEKSPHKTCEAVDFADADGNIKKYVLNNLGILDTCDLYMEDPARTPTWIHLDTRRRTNRVFKP